jgi:hypothetical protein
MPQEAITIDLAVGDVNGTVKAGNLIQKKSYEDLYALIRTGLVTAQKQRGRASSDPQGDTELHEMYPPGSGLVYFVDGTRGAGKSTFLRTAFAEIPDRREDDEAPPVKLAQLAYIDPSRIEQNELILLSVLKHLQRLIENQLRRRLTQRDEALREPYRATFKKLAECLIVLDKNHNQLKHVDAELYADWGLERAGHSADLRIRLSQLLEQACDLLDVDALLLAFDDADTKAEHAHAVLECIRNYLDTPRLVILVTGDMELYSLLVRDRFHRELNHGKAHSGTDREQQRIRMVDHLEEQYLLKLFPIRRRLQLRPLWNLLNSEFGRNDSPYLLTHSGWAGGRNPRVVLDEIIRRVLRIKAPADIALYGEFLLKQPLRSVLQILSRCGNVVAKSDDQGQQSNIWDPQLAEATRDSLRGMALGSLYKLNVDVDAIAAHEMAPLIEAVFDLGVIDGDFDTATYLRPQSSEADIRNCFVALSADVAMLCAERPANSIQYMFGGAGSVALFGQVLRRRKRQDSEDATLLRQFKKYMGVGRKEDALNWARHATIIIGMPYVQINTRPVVHFGVIGLNKSRPGLAPKESGYATIESVINTVSGAEKSKLPVFALSLVDLSGMGSRTYASIFNTVGLIARLLSIGLREGDENKVSYEGAVSTVLGKAYPAVSVSRPEWESEDINVEDAEPEEDQNKTELELLTSAVVSWLEATLPYREKIAPSALLMGKVWTRLYFSLEKVCHAKRRDVKPNEVGAADLMELFALCVINAFYVEEIDHHLNPQAVDKDLQGIQDRRNPQTSAKAFLDRLRKVSKHREDLPLTYLIATCPLLVGLLSPDQVTQAAVKVLLSRFDTADTSEPASVALPKTLAVVEDKHEQQEIYSAENVMCDEAAWSRINRAYIAGMDWGEVTGEQKVSAAKKPVRRSRKGAAVVVESSGNDV